MNLKKITAFLLCSLVALPFAGCKKELPPTTTGASSAAKSGSTASAALVPESGATLRFRTSGSTDVEFSKAVAANFKKKYGVTVNVEEGNQGENQKVVTEAQSGKGPDVLMLPHDKATECIKAGVFLQLDDSIVKELNSTIRPVALKSVTDNGKLYGVPVSMEAYVLFYNKKLVKTPVTTFEQMKKEAQSFNNPKKNKFYFLFDASTASPVYPMLSTYGFMPFGKDGTDANNPGFNTTEFEKGLEVLKDYHNVVPIKSDDLGNTDFLRTRFEKGDAAYMMSGPWDVKTFRTAGVDLGAVPLPTYDGHTQKEFAFIQNAHVSAFTKYPKAAQLFAASLVSSESADLLYSKAARITCRTDVSKVNGFANDDVLKTISKAFDQAVPTPSIKRMDYYWTISNDVCAAVFNGSMTPQNGAKTAQKDFEDYVKQE